LIKILAICIRIVFLLASLLESKSNFTFYILRPDMVVKLHQSINQSIKIETTVCETSTWPCPDDEKTVDDDTGCFYVYWVD